VLFEARGRWSDGYHEVGLDGGKTEVGVEMEVEGWSVRGSMSTMSN